jgi:hypothetical protein
VGGLREIKEKDNQHRTRFDYSNVDAGVLGTPPMDYLVMCFLSPAGALYLDGPTFWSQSR